MMSTSNESQFVNTSQACRIYGIKNDEALLAFLGERTIKPMSESPYGRGLIRWWDRATLLRLHGDFVKWNEVRRAAINEQSRANIRKAIGVRADRGGQLSRIEQKLDQLLAIWGGAKK